MTNSWAESVSLAPESERTVAVKSLTESRAAELLYDWKFWGRPDQLEPPGDWQNWLILAGRGFGKTRCGAEWVRSQVCGKTPLSAGKARRIALVAETAADARDVMIKGDKSGLLAIHPRDFRPTYVPSTRSLTWPNGAIATTYNAVEPDQLRGPQHDCFIAGTLIETLDGPKPVESVHTGDMVWTRAGFRRVEDTRSRLCDVGRVTFSNGKELVGDADHPVLTSHGWTMMSCLRKGSMVCAPNVSSGAASAGIDTMADTTNIAELAAWGARTVSAFIELSTKKILALFQPATMSTTWMGTSGTTASTISSVWRAESTHHFTIRRGRQDQIGRQSRALKSLARIALRFSSGSWLSPTLSVSPVSPSEPSVNGLAQSAANTAAVSSPAASDSFAVSVVSTWEPAGNARVFNLQVAEQPEYVANGIVVHNCAWSDELAKWRYSQETWDQLQFGLRQGDNPRQVITTTPRPIAIVRMLMADTKTFVTRGNTFDNRSNLAPSFLEKLEQRYVGTRLGRQELNAEVLEDAPDALWTRANLDQHRRKEKGMSGPLKEAPALKRIVVAIDPAAKTNEMKEDGAATGIVAAAVGEDNRGYVLDDATVRASPNGWARRAVSVFDRFEADAIVAEVNNGGDMVEATIRSVRSQLPVIKVHASRGKWTRAEPVAALYEQGRISHVGTFAELEDEMVLFGPNGLADGVSPDRVDALVWALTELFPQLTAREPRKQVAEPRHAGGREGWMG